MKKFRFSLETVLKVRRQNEELRRRELAVAQGMRDRALAELVSHKKDLRGLLAEQSKRREGAIDLGREAWYMAGWGGLTQKIRLASVELAGKEEALAVCRTRAVEASRERLVLEKLEETQLQEHLSQLNREEQGLLDDLAQRAVSAFSLPPVSVVGPSHVSAAQSQ
jgi:flagellar FliJ protein